MVLFHTDSNTSLVSLGNGRKPSQLSAVSAGEHQTKQSSFQCTKLYLPKDELFDDEDDFAGSPVDIEQPIYLNRSYNDVESVDEYLQCIPQIRDACDELLAVAPVHFTCTSSERILYASQGEVAHAVPSQCDVLVSDHATTCHILAIRSVSDSTAEPLGSITHLDGTHYEECVREMIQRHKIHHSCSFNTDEGKKDDYSTSSSQVELEFHVMGGFADTDGSSRKISNWLIQLLADIASEEQDGMHFVMKTCAISSMNDTGYGAPVGRGLALDFRSGRCFLAQCDSDVAGPKTTLRSARLLAEQTEPQKLSCIYSEMTSKLVIEPFQYSALPQTDLLLSLPDEVLLKFASTSPDCEQDDFCSQVRSTLKFLRNSSCHFVFGKDCATSLVYRRVGQTNSWQPCR